MLVKKYFRDAQCLWIQCFRFIAYNSTRLSCQSCNYGAFIDLSPYSPWAICLHKSRMCFISGFHGDAAAILGPQQLSRWRGPERCFHIPVPHYQLASWRYRQVKSSIRRLCISRLFDHNRAPLSSVCLADISQAVTSWQITLLKSVFIAPDNERIPKTEVSGHISYIILDSFFSKRYVSQFLAVLYIQRINIFLPFKMLPKRRFLRIPKMKACYYC